MRTHCDTTKSVRNIIRSVSDEICSETDMAKTEPDEICNEIYVDKTGNRNESDQICGTNDDRIGVQTEPD